MSNFPKMWPTDQKGMSLDVLPKGTILESRSLKGESSSERPEDAIGWLVQTIGDGLFMPKQDVERPENVLWLIPGDGGGFKLIHSGPLHDGVSMSVDSEQRITYGQDSSGMKEKNKSQRYWPYRFYEKKKAVLFSLGNVASYGGAASPKTVMVFHDGLPYSMYEGREDQ